MHKCFKVEGFRVEVTLKEFDFVTFQYISIKYV